MGVAKGVVDDALTGVDEEENAYQAASKLIRRLDQADYATFRKKLVGYLRRRGFGTAAMSRTVQRLWLELSDPHYSHIDSHSKEHQQKDDVDRRRDR